MRIHFFIILLSLAFFTTHAQDQYTLSGRVTVAEDKPLAYATALLLSASDSTMIKGSD